MWLGRPALNHSPATMLVLGKRGSETPMKSYPWVFTPSIQQRGCFVHG